MRIKILYALITLTLLVSISSGQMADLDKRNVNTTENSETEQVVESYVEPQGLLPSIKTTSQPQIDAEGSEWINLKGIRLTTPPTATSPGGNVVDVFAGGNENELWHIRYQGDWSEWTKTFGPPPYNKNPGGVSFRKYDLSVVYTKSEQSDGYYHLFTWGATNQCLYKKCWLENGKITCNQTEDWIQIEGEIGSRPAAVVVSNRIYLFSLNDTGQLIWNRADVSPKENGGQCLVWEGWSPLAGASSKLPPTVTYDDRSIHIFLLNEDKIMHLTWSMETGKINIEIIKSEIISAPAATSCGYRLDLFGTDDRKKLMHTWYNGTAWQKWKVELHGSEMSGQPATICDETSRIWTFAQGEGESLWGITLPM